MTIEQLIELPGDDLARISDADLERYLAPYFPFTRPANTAPATEQLGGKLLDALTPEMRARVQALAQKQKPVKFK